MSSWTCFNPRPRTGSDRLPGVTRQAVTVYRFNPRPRTGSDWSRGQGDVGSSPILFQSTPPHGERPITLTRAGMPSCPRPARGATPRSGSPLKRCFNPRPRTGSDLGQLAVEACWSATLFQSTPPHGERHWSATRQRSYRPLMFQSTPPHGERPIASVAPALREPEFQSTPPHGERP